MPLPFPDCRSLGRVNAVAGLVLVVAAGGCSTMSSPGGSAIQHARCADVNFPIYFAKGSDQLSDPARDAIAAGQAQVRGCTIREVDVFGLADMDGPAASNLDLSKRRAAVVARSLAAIGLPGPLFDVQGLGESGSRTAKGAPTLLQRKAVVVIRVTPT